MIPITTTSTYIPIITVTIPIRFIVTIPRGIVLAGINASASLATCCSMKSRTNDSSRITESVLEESVKWTWNCDRVRVTRC